MGSLAANIKQRILHFINLSSFFSLSRNIRFPSFLAIAVILLFLENHLAGAATIIWNGLGSDGTCGTGNGNNWSCGQNWAGGVAPGSSDNVQFDATSTKDAVIDTTYTGSVTAVDIKSSYTGTITQSRTFIIGSGGYVQAAGVFNGGGFAVDNNGSFTLSGGTFNAPSSSLFIAGNFTHTAGGTFNHNSGTVVFDFASLSSVTADVNTSETFNHLTINKTGGGNLVISAADTLTVLGTLTLTDGNIDGGISSIVDAQGAIVHGTDFDGGSGHLTISGSSTRTINLTGGGQLPRTTVTASNITINGPSSGTVTFDGVLRWDAGTFSGGAGNLDLNSSFTLTAGTFTAPSGSMFVAGNFTHTVGGTFTHNNGTVVLDSNTATIDVTTTETFNNLTVNKLDVSLTVSSGDTLEVMGTLGLSNGNIDTGTINSYGNLIHISTFDGGNGTINIIGSNTRTINLTGGGQLPNVFVNAANVTINGASSGTVSVDSNFSLQSGAFSGGAGDFTLSAGFSQSGGTVSLGNGLFTANGSFTLSNGTFTAGAGNTAFNAGLTLTGGTFNMGSGALTVTNAAFSQSAGTFNGGTTGSADFNNPFNLSGGIFNAPKTTFFSSYLTQTGGAFNHNNGKAVFDAFFSMGIDVTTTITFNDLEFALTSTSTAGIAEADVIIAAGQLSLKDGLVSSQSVTSTLGAQGNVTVSPTFDGGNTPLIFTGGNSQVFDLTGATDKFDADVSINKTSGSTVTLASDLIIDSVVADQDLIIISGTLDLASHNLTVGDDFAINGTCTTGSSNTITVTDSLSVSTSVGNFNGQNSTINAGRVTIAGGTFTSTSGTLTVLGNWTHTSTTAVFNHNNGTVVFGGTANTVADVNSNENFYNLTINKTSGSGGITDELTITSTDSLTVLGTLQMTTGQSQSGTLGAEGNVNVGSGFTGGGTSLIFKGSNVQNFNLTGAVGKFDSDITVNKTGGEVDLLSDLTMDAANQDLFITAGTFDINGHNLTVNGSSGTFILQSAGNFQLQGNETTTSPQQQSGSNITYDGSGSYSSLVLGNTYTSNLSFKGTGSWQHTSALTANANLFINSGTLNSGGQGINIVGNWDNTGTYISGNNTVTFTGSNQVIGGTTIFNNLTKTVSVASTLTLPAGVTNTILGTMTLQGSSSSARLSLRSSVNGTQTQIDPQGSRIVQHLDVKDDKNINATAISCLTGCISAGNNYNWLFGNQTMQFASSSSSGTEGVTSVNLGINLSSSLADDATVNYAVTGGSANGGGVDYTLANGTVTITAGNTTANIPITIVDDALNELNETIQVTLSNPINVTLGSQTVHTYTITNDDAQPNVTLSLTGSPMVENAGQSVVKATLSAVSGQNVTVDLSFSGTALLTDDYTRSGTQIVINAGQTEGTVTLTAVQDLLNEGAETIIADISNVTNGTESGTQQVTATITDDDTAPSVTLSLTGSPMVENAGQATVKATLSAVSGQNVTVDLTFTGTATLTDDYTRSGTQIVINAGQTEGTVTLTAVQDLLNEGAETIIADISNVTNGTESGTQQVTATITDDDTAPSVTLSLTGSPMVENAGQATVKATLSAVSGQNVTVDLTFTGTATLTDDYTRSGTQIVINAGQTEGTVTLTAVQDLLNEPAETIIADISNVTNGTESGTQQVTATITDDDTAPTVTLSLTGSPMVENAGQATVKATLSAVSGQNVTVDLSFSGTALLTDDYTRSGTQIVINAGQTEGTVTLTAVQDLLNEPAETIIADISNVTNGTESGTQQVTATITDDDTAPSVTLSLTGSPMVENAGQATVKATLSAVSGQNVTVDLTFTGTATLTDDYTRSGTQIVINAGQTEGTVTLTAVQDLLNEPAETIIADISNVTNGTESGTQQVTATITDDDTAPSVTLSLTGSPMVENAGQATVKATLSAVSGQNVTVDLSFSGTALLTDDYTRSGTQIVINAGQTEGTVTLTAVQDLLNEPAETIIADISNVTNGTESGTQQVTATITDDDTAPSVTLSLTGSPMVENAGQATVKATLSAVSGQNVTVDLTFTGTATLTDDYTRSGTQIVINAGQTEGTVTLTAVQDLLNEPAETIIADISNVTNGTESGTQQVTATITDDDTAPSVTLSLTGSPMVENAGQATVKATLSAVSGQNVTVDLTFTGTATLTDDYTRSGTQIVINAGQTEGTVTLTAVQDLLNEPAETIIADISNVTNGTESGTQQVTATITDDDTAPSVTLSLTGSPMVENAGQATVKATLSAVSGQNVTVDLTFTGTAALTDDYTRSGTQIVINAGQTEGTVTLTAVSDSINEGPETIIADISNVTNGTESGTQQVTATITDDDAAPSVFYSQASQTQNENSGVVTVQIELSAPSGFEVTIPFTVGGNARNPEDYSITSSPVIIPAGEISANISLQVVDDSISESDETVQITMGTPINASQGSTTEHIITLDDNDALPDVRFELSESSGSENTSSVMIRVMLSEASEQSITVDYLASGGTASGSGEDYILDSGSLTFDPSDTVKSIELTIVNDDEDETDETVEISLSDPENAVLAEHDVFIYTIEDNDGQDNEGTITMTADNCYVLYVNGVQIGSDCDWQTVENYTVNIQEGDVIAIRADDTGGIGGLAFQIQQGQNLQVSDFTWHVSSINVPPEGWEQAGFDASHWMGATEHYKMGEGPWGTLAGFDPSVKWIWNKNILFDNRVFFITQFHPDQNALVKVSADNAFEAFVNGEEIGQGDAWPAVKFLPAHIEEGDVIAIHGADSGGLGGILSETLWRDESGNLRKIFSDATWKSSANYDNGWLDQDFDDSSWLFATPYGKRGVYPWGNSGNLLEISSQASWIWSAHASSDNDVWVRKQVPNGNIQITADNKYELYVNGRLIGTGISWLDVQDYSVYLEEGDVIAVKAENLGGPAGVISSIVLNGEVLLTNSSWKIQNQEETGWNEKDFDDSSWDQAKSFGSNDVWPWGRRVGIDPRAMWIWTHAPETDNIVFLRFKIGQPNVPQGLTKIECTADDEYSLYHNGYKVLEGNSWRISKSFYAEISSGDVLAIQVKDKGYKAGLLLNASGTFNFTSDETWKWRIVEETGWQGLNFNDSGWLSAHSYGSYGAQPWSLQVIGFPGSSAALWIWSNRNETGGFNRDTNVFFRKNID